MLVQLRKLNKKMRKLEQRYEAAEGQPLKQARLLRSAASTQRSIDKILDLINGFEGGAENVQEEGQIITP